MTQLTDPTTDSSSSSSSSNSDHHSSTSSEDQGATGNTGGTAMKRSRQRPYQSSLDYKLGANENPAMYAIPPRPINDPTPGHSMYDHNNHNPAKYNNNKVTSTRARGSTGIPPKTLSLDDLKGLDKETLTRVLHENPDLAAEVERLRQNENGSSSSRRRRSDETLLMDPPKRMTTTSMGGTMNRKNHQRRTDGTVHKQQQNGLSYLEEMRKDGVPVLQWLVLLILLGGLFYQLYKTLKGPGTTNHNHYKKKKGVPVAAKDKRSSVDSDLVKRLAEEVGPAVQPATAASSSSSKKKTLKKRTPAKTKPTTVAKPATTTTATTATASSSSSSATKEINGHTTKSKNKTVPTDPAVSGFTLGNPAIAPEDEGDWKVVGDVTKATGDKKKAARGEVDEALTGKAPATGLATTAATTAPLNGSSEAETNDTQISTRETNGKVTQGGGSNGSSSNTTKVQSPGSDPVQSTDDCAAISTTRKNKKKSKTKKIATNQVETDTATNGALSSSAVQPITTENDAALAQQLQQEEEENLASGSSLLPSASSVAAAALSSSITSDTDTTWEEVVTKKRRSKAE